jgi:hypothetical protein
MAVNVQAGKITPLPNSYDEVQAMFHASQRLFLCIMDPVDPKDNIARNMDEVMVNFFIDRYHV